MYLRDRGPTEIGGSGISAPGELLVVEDVTLVPQECTSVTTALDDTGVADYFEAQVDAGRRPEEFARLWVHTHSGDCPLPSSVDEETFARVFGSADWAVMFILARGGAVYARLRFSAGPSGQMRIPVEIDFKRAFDASDQSAWDREYQANVRAARTELPIDRFDRFDDLWLAERAWHDAATAESIQHDTLFLPQETLR
ncbi:MAG TPA: hypothetical protein VHZ24_13635 [Pirellulales bacterium]|nr:hypothetical protein [Pirellulales bacterium]